MLEIEIEFKVPVSWIDDLVKSHSARIKVRDIRKTSKGTMDLIEVFFPEGNVKAMAEDIEKYLPEENSSLKAFDDNHATAIVDAGDCPICRNMQNWDLFLTEAFTEGNGDMLMRLLVPDDATAVSFLKRLEDDGVKFRLVKNRNLTRKSDLTARQEFVVRTAFDLGFFDYPKKVNLEGLSERLNVSFVTLSEILRRAEKNIISSYFRQKGE